MDLLRFNSRKLIVFIIAFTTGIVLSYLGKLDNTVSDFIVYMTGAYLASNVGNKILERFKN